MSATAEKTRLATAAALAGPLLDKSVAFVYITKVFFIGVAYRRNALSTIFLTVREGLPGLHQARLYRNVHFSLF
jgi:hypothetical protein